MCCRCFRAHCINHHLLLSPPVCYAVLFSFASLPYTSPSPPRESAPELQREFVSLDGEQKGSQGKIMQVKRFFLTSFDFIFIVGFLLRQHVNTEKTPLLANKLHEKLCARFSDV